MKKYLCLLLLTIIPTAYALDTANVKLNIQGATKDNSYFVCIPNVGCLSILAASRGKVFPIFHPIEMNTLFVANQYTMRLYPQGLPDSCDVTVSPNQTITIEGTLVERGQTVTLEKLHCKVA